MVVFVDLEQDVPGSHDTPGRRAGLARHIGTGRCALPYPIAMPRQEQQRKEQETSTHTRENPNVNTFSAALGCYPIAKELARSIDLNTLHALSRTCRQFRMNLLQFRHQLIKETVRCDYEQAQPLSGYLEGKLSSTIILDVLHLLVDDREEARRLTSGKIGQCARDMVLDCKKCSRIVCRVR